MVSPMKAVVVLVQQLIEEYKLNDPTVIAQVSISLSRQVIIPTCTTVLVLVMSYRLLHSTYRSLWPLPPEVRYRQAIELYSGGSRRKTIQRSRIVVTNRNKKTTMSDASTRGKKRLARQQHDDQRQALRQFEQLVIKDQYGPALLSLVVHQLYVASDPKEALRLLDLAATTNSTSRSGSSENNCKNIGERKNNNQHDRFSPFAPSSFAAPLKSSVVVLSSKTQQIDHTTLKLDAQALLSDSVSTSSTHIITSSSSSKSYKDNKSNNKINNNDNVVKKLTMTGINSKMMKLDYLGVT